MTIQEKISANDPQGMLQLLERFGESFDDALSRAGAFTPAKQGAIDGVVICGMGGSALGAELARGFCADELSVPLEIVRDYTLPAWVGPRTLVLAFSYSGETEETLSAARDALEKKAQLIVATSGGALDGLATEHKLPSFLIPGGLPPRLSIHYFMALTIRLLSLHEVGDEVFYEGARAEIARATEDYAPDKEKNPAIQLAEKLQKRTVMIYGSGAADSIVRIWKSQLNENAKQFVHVGHMSELNHNEILVWPYLKEQTARPVALLIHSWQDNEQMHKRFDFTAKHLAEDGVEVLQLRSQSKERGAELFHLVMLGVWASYYAAILSGRDPMNIDSINSLKAYLD